MMSGEEFTEELYRENLYFVYEDKCKELEKEIEKLKEENEFLKQLIPNDKKYSYGIRMGSEKE